MTSRNYSLFQRDGKRWTRVSGAGAYSKATAVRVFQDRLLRGYFSSGPELMLRPVKDEADRTPANQVLCGPCAAHLHNCSGGDCSCGCRMVRK